MKLESKFDIGACVHIDGEQGIKGTVTAVMWRAQYACPAYEVSFIVNGTPQTPWVEEFRLELASKL